MSDYGDEILSNLEHTDTNLQVARELLDKGYYDVSASRVTRPYTLGVLCPWGIGLVALAPCKGRVSPCAGKFIWFNS